MPALMEYRGLDTYINKLEAEDIIEWSEREYVISREFGGRGAGMLKVRPIQVEPLRAITERRCRRLVGVFFSRFGKTTMILLIQFHNICTIGASAIFAYPSGKKLGEWNTQKVQPVLDINYSIREKIILNRNGKLSDKGLYYRGGGAGVITYITGQSTAAFNGLTAEMAIIDETDKCKLEFPDGPYDALMLQRGDDALNPIMIELGTPDAQNSALEASLLKSDYREYYIIHYSCGKHTRLLWENVYSDDITEEMRIYGIPDELRSQMGQLEWHILCEECEEKINDEERIAALKCHDSGEWRPRFPERSHYHRGYHANQFYSEDHTIAEIMASYDPDDVTGFYTQKLARTAPNTEITVYDDDEFTRFRKDMTPEEMETLICVVAGVDVQTGKYDSRMEMTLVYYYGDRYQPKRYIKSHDKFAIVDEDFVSTLRAIRQHLRYEPLYPDMIFIDSGGSYKNNADKLKAAVNKVFTRSYLHNKIKVCKGTGEQDSSNRWGQMPLLKDELERGTTTNHTKTVIIYSSVAKTRLFRRGGIFDAGKITFSRDPKAFHDTYWAQVNSEHLVRKKTNSKSKKEEVEWEKINPYAPNEALDCLVYAEGAKAYLGFDFVRPQQAAPDKDHIAKVIGV